MNLVSNTFLSLRKELRIHFGKKKELDRQTGYRAKTQIEVMVTEFRLRQRQLTTFYLLQSGAEQKYIVQPI